MEEIRTGCRRCLLRESGEEEMLESIRKAVARLPETEKVPGSTYEQRLSLCRECGHLLSGTCLLCGCYVELRAAIRRQQCPGRPCRWKREA